MNDVISSLDTTLITSCKKYYTSILSRMDGEKMYIPALILLETNSGGFSTNFSIAPDLGSYTTTPYLLGSSTFVTWNKTLGRVCFCGLTSNYVTNFDSLLPLLPYRTYHRFKLGTRRKMTIFWSLLKWYFSGSWSSIKNCLEPKIKPSIAKLV